MRNKHVMVAVLVTYLVMSFMPSLSIRNVIGMGKGKAAGS